MISFDFKQSFTEIAEKMDLFFIAKRSLLRFCQTLKVKREMESLKGVCVSVSLFTFYVRFRNYSV